jgi:hypothetical protein
VNFPIKREIDILARLNKIFREGLLLKSGLKGEIIEITLAPNESKTISHGLRVIPKYRIILRQTGDSVITDVDSAWTERTIGLKNNSANTVTITIKLLPG